MKLIDWTALNAPKRLVEFDRNLAFPAFLPEQDIIEILKSGNSIFWEQNPHDLSLFDYAYIDKISGLVYSNKNIRPTCITFHFSSLAEEKLDALQEVNKSMVIIDFLYVSMLI